MIRQELALKLAAMGSMRRWDPQVQCVYDDTRRLRVPFVADRLRRYDPALYLRFNALAERWELFRWRGENAPTPDQIVKIPPEEMAARGMFLWTVQENDGGFCEPDARTIRKVQDGDLFARFGSSSAKAIADAMDEEDRLREAKDKRDRQDAYVEEALRIEHHIQGMTGNRKIISHRR